MPDNSGKRIFIAEVAEPMREYKANLIRELENNGCEVHLINNAELIDEKYFDLIEHCDFAVHLLSNDDLPEGDAKKGLEEQQIEFSLQHLRRLEILEGSAESHFKILAWFPRHFSHGYIENESFAPHLERVQQLEGKEFLQTNFEEFKQYLLQKIHEEEKREEDFFIKGDEDQSIYFIYDKTDRDLAERYILYLRRRGFKVLKPLFKGDVLAVRQTHKTF